MKKTEIDENRLTALIETLLKEHPPSTEKNIIAAYQELVDCFQGITTCPDPWLEIYREGRPAAEVVSDILKKPKKRFSGSGGWDGKRGKSKAWDLYREAEEILFNAKEISEENKEVFKLVMADFAEAYNPKERKHWMAVALLFGENHPLAMMKSATGGKSVTLQSIHNGVKDFRRHIFSKKGTKDSQVYGDKKFYYLTWLTHICDLYVDFLCDPKREQAIKEIQDILSAFTSKERLKITREAIRRQTFCDEASSALKEHFDNLEKLS